MRRLAVMPKLHSATGSILFTPHQDELFRLMKVEMGFECIKQNKTARNGICEKEPQY